MSQSFFSLKKLKKTGFAAAALLTVSACASAPHHTEANDPLEDVNRAVYYFNDAIDTLFLQPLTEFYRGVVPPPVRGGIHNALANLSTPVILVNDVLQGEFDRAQVTLTRFAINTTVGIGGLGDPATDYGYERHSEDFGQTLATWGVGDGPYIVLPIFGPSNPRDAVGRVVDYFTDPVNHWVDNTDRDSTGLAYTALKTLDTRDQLWDALDDIQKNSLDPYAAMRSFYRQNRMKEIMNGQQPRPYLSIMTARLPMILNSPLLNKEKA